MKQQLLGKRKAWVKTFLLSGCIMIFSTSAVFALPAGAGHSEPARQAPYSEEVVSMQAEIDQFLFAEHASELGERGINVTHTSPNGEVVEIGITNYNDVAASYLAEQLASYDVVIVEGEQAYTLAHPVADTLPTGDTPVSTWDAPVSPLPADADSGEVNAVQQMQAEIDQFLFEEHASELEARGIQVTHTGPLANDVVEIGIVDYNEAAAAYLTEQLTDYDVEIVEGEQAQLFAEAGAVTPISAELDSASEAIDAGATDNKGSTTIIIALAVGALLLFILFAAYGGKSRQND